MQLVAFLQHLEHLQASRNDHWRQRVREQVRTRTLTQHLYYFLAACGESTDRAAKCLSKRAGEHIDPAIAVELLGDAMTSLTHDACRMTFVNHHEGFVLICQIADFVHRCHIAIHRENAIGADDSEPLSLGLFQATLKVGHVCIGVAITHCLAETNAVDDGCVVQGIGNDSVFGSQQRFEKATVGIEARRIKNSVFSVEEVRNSSFQPLVQILSAAYETHRRHSETSVVHSLLRSFDEPWRIRQSEIVICAEIQSLAPVFESDFSRLRGSYIPFIFVKPSLFDRSQFVLKMFLEFAVHCYIGLK